MKTIFIYLAFLCGSITMAQDLAQSQVPAPILNQFKSEFPDATRVEWEMKGNLYKVEFDKPKAKEFEAWYDAQGNRKKLKEELRSRDLPAAIKKSINTSHQGFRVDDVEKITENGVVKYKIEIEKAAQEVVLFFNEKGEPVK